MAETSLRGRISLVGAGPGDPGLMTLRGAYLLQRADVVLYDAPVADVVLEHANQRCERILGRQRDQYSSGSQSEIEALMLCRAAAGDRVVRLTTGDSLLCGRGAQEAQALQLAGVAFDIVPGVSSLIAAAAYAGIPLADALASALTVATDRDESFEPISTLDWSKLADPGRTLFFVLTVANLTDIGRRLIEHGLLATTPAAVVANGTRPSQRTVGATLERIAQAAQDAGIAAPCVLIAGNVVRLREKIRGFDRLPLFARRVLVTRPDARAGELAAGLRALGADPIVAPVLRIEPPDDDAGARGAIEELPAYQWLVFTSVPGVDAFFARLTALGRDARYVGHVKVAAIGPATQARLAGYGIRADVTPAHYMGEAAASALIAEAQPSDRVLIFRAQEAREVLPRMLDDAGLRATVVSAYRSVVVQDDAFAQKVARADVLTFTSGGCVRAFSQLLGGSAPAVAAARGKTVACIGPIVAGAAREAGLTVDIVADAYTSDGLLDALERHFTP